MNGSGPSGLSPMDVSSPAFNEGGEIPRDFTCDGENISPPMRWSGVPAGAVELALAVDDPDAPAGIFNHWSVWGIAPDISELRAGERPQGTRQGLNGFGRQNYSGPCPPKGTRHRYVFTVWGLSRRLDLTSGATIESFRQAVREAAVAQGELTALYGR